jgi:hypothetical protein
MNVKFDYQAGKRGVARHLEIDDKTLGSSEGKKNNDSE